MPDVMPAPAADRFQDPVPALILANIESVLDHGIPTFGEKGPDIR
jgi:hypothetical protein